MMVDAVKIELPELDCGLCGYRTCGELRERLATSPEMIRPLHSSFRQRCALGNVAVPPKWRPCRRCACGKNSAASLPVLRNKPPEATWRDSLGREIDFYLEHFPEEPGPREIIIPHNPMITREMEIKRATSSSAARWGCRADAPSRIAAWRRTSISARA